jgi:hypothetical protein
MSAKILIDLLITPQKYHFQPKSQKGPWDFFFKFTFMEQFRGPLLIATIAKFYVDMFPIRTKSVGYHSATVCRSYDQPKIRQRRRS